MKSFALLILLGICATIRADVLYWQVSNETAAKYPSVTTAKLYVGSAAGKEHEIAWSGIVVTRDPAMRVQAYDLSGLAKLGYTDPTALSFYVELYSFNEGTYDLQAFSAAASYESLKDFMASSIQSVPLNAWNGGTFTAAPEPTGGLLMLIGLGLIGLRRRPVA